VLPLRITAIPPLPHLSFRLFSTKQKGLRESQTDLSRRPMFSSLNLRLLGLLFYPNGDSVAEAALFVKEKITSVLPCG